jgi:hypothetical protein
VSFFFIFQFLGYLRNKQGIKTGGRKEEEKVTGGKGENFGQYGGGVGGRSRIFDFQLRRRSGRKGFAPWSPAKTKVYTFMCTIQEGKKESGRVFDLAVSWIRCRC